jgi:chromosome segregation ATPase
MPTTSAFKSPLRKLVPHFKGSRDRWKARQKESIKLIKRLKVRAYDLEQSRESWARKANEKEQANRELRQQLAELQSQVSQLKEQLKKNVTN